MRTSRTAGPLLEVVGLRATLVATGAVYLATTLTATGLPALRDLDRRASSAAHDRASFDPRRRVEAY